MQTDSTGSTDPPRLTGSPLPETWDIIMLGLHECPDCEVPWHDDQCPECLMSQDSAEEPGYSQTCDECATTLTGNRWPATALASDGVRSRRDICKGCVSRLT